MVSHDCVAFYLLSEEVEQARQGGAVRPGRRRDLRRLPLVSADGPRRRRRSARRAEPYRQAFFDRDHDAVSRAAAADAWRLDDDVAGEFVARSTSPTRRRDGDRPGAAARHHRDAGRRSGQAGRQHDHGLGAGGPRAVPRPRAGRARCHLPARAEDRATAARACSRRPPAGSFRTRSSTGPRAIFRCPALKHLAGPYLDLVRDALHSRRARDRGLFALRSGRRGCSPIRTATSRRCVETRCGRSGLLELWLARHVDGAARS